MDPWDTIICSPEFENKFVGGHKNGQPVPPDLRDREYITVAIPPVPRLIQDPVVSEPYKTVMYRRKAFSMGHSYYDRYHVWIRL